MIKSACGVPFQVVSWTSCQCPDALWRCGRRGSKTVSQRLVLLPSCHIRLLVGNGRVNHNIWRRDLLGLLGKLDAARFPAGMSVLLKCCCGMFALLSCEAKCVCVCARPAADLDGCWPWAGDLFDLGLATLCEGQGSSP